MKSPVEAMNERFRRNREAERASWQILGDRSLTLAATVLGLSVLFLSRDVRLVDTHFLKWAWISFGSAVAAGVPRLVADWMFNLWELKRRRRSGMFSRISLVATGITLIGLLVGLVFMMIFAWINLDFLTAAEMSVET